MKKLLLISCLASLTLTVSAQDDLSDYQELQLNTEYDITAYKPFKGKVTPMESGQIIVNNNIPVYVLGEDNELRMLTDEEHPYAGYINNQQTWQFAATAGTTYYLYDRFPMSTAKLILRMNPAVEMTTCDPVQGTIYDYAEKPHVAVTFNQNLNIGKATVSVGELSEEAIVRALGANVSVEINSALIKWFAADQIKEGDNLTVTLSEIKDGIGKAVDDIVLTFKVPGKPYKLVNYKLPKVIKSYMPVSSDDTKAVFTFSGPVGPKPDIRLCYSPQELGYDYEEPLTAVVDGNTIVVDFAGKIRAHNDMCALDSPLPNFNLHLYMIRDARGQMIDAEDPVQIGSFVYSIPYEMIPRVDIMSSFTPAAGASLTGTDNIKIYLSPANKFSFSGVGFSSGSETVVVTDFEVNQISAGEKELTVAIPAGWNTKSNVIVSLDGITTEDGYDHSGDVTAKYNGFTVTFSAPANGSRLSQIAKNNTISIDTNLGEGAEVTVTIKDQDGKAIYGPAPMQSRSAGSYTHTMTKTVKFYRGNSYKIVFTTGSESEEITIEGSASEYEYNGWELVSMDPADGSNIKAGATINVKFTGPVAIVPVDGTVAFTTERAGDVDPNDEGVSEMDNAWNIKIAPEATGKIDLIFAAVDSSNVPTLGNEGEDAESHYHFTFTVDESSITEIESTAKVREGIYDLQGRKLAAPVRGINIINGRKVMVK